MATPQYERKALPPDLAHVYPKRWADWLEPLTEHPRQWHRFPRSTPAAAKQLAHALRCGIRRTPPGRWEFTARGWVMWARYLGPEE